MIFPQKLNKVILFFVASPSYIEDIAADPLYPIGYKYFYLLSVVMYKIKMGGMECRFEKVCTIVKGLLALKISVLNPGFPKLIGLGCSNRICRACLS